MDKNALSVYCSAMTTFGKLLVIALLLIIVSLAALLWITPGKVHTPQQTTETTQTSTDATQVASTTQPAPITDDKTYTNKNLSFSVMYPSVAVPSPVDFTSFLTLTQSPLASFTLPRSMFEGTNLGDAGVYVGASAKPNAITSCGSAATGETAAGTETINGADFSVFSASDAGAGNFYESKIYRRLENGWCVELVELLHSTNIANYAQGTVKAFDKPYFGGILDSIVHTYKSIPTGV